MNSFQQVATTRHEYRLKTWQRIFSLLLGGAAIFLGAFVAWKVALSANPYVLTLTIMPFTLFGLYVCAWALRSRIVLEGTRIEVRGAVNESAADLNEIEGFRTFSTRNGTYTQLSLKEGRGKITISQSFNTDDDYRAWFQQLTDLDARDRDALLDKISQDAELGSSPEERLNALNQAKIVSIAAAVVAIAAAIGLNFGAADFRLPSAVALALAPVAVLFLMRQSPLLYMIFKQKKQKSDPRADFSVVLLAAGFGLAMPFYRVEFVSMKPLLLLIVIVALVYIAAFFNSARGNNPIAATVIGLLFVALSYSLGLAIEADTLLDGVQATNYTVQVTGKHIHRGKSTTYYLDLAPWGPLEEPNQIRVVSRIYNDIQQGDQICLALHPGRLHSPWYQLSDCPVTPVTGPAQ
jgi:hypothetical protein